MWSECGPAVWCQLTAQMRHPPPTSTYISTQYLPTAPQSNIDAVGGSSFPLLANTTFYNGKNSRNKLHSTFIHPLMIKYYDLLNFSVSVSQFILGRQVARLVTPVGSSTVWSMVSSLMVICHQIKHLEMTVSQHFSPRLAQVQICTFTNR